MSFDQQVAQVQQPAAEREAPASERDAGGQEAGNAAAADVMALEGANPNGTGDRRRRRGGTTASGAAATGAQAQAAGTQGAAAGTGAIEEQALRDLVASAPASAVLIRLAGLDIATRDVAANLATAQRINVWDRVVNGLPRGTALDSGTRSAMYRAAVHGNLALTEIVRLFGIRFAHAAVRGNTDWTQDVLLATWRQLDVLPDQDVTANNVYQAFAAISGGGGLYGHSAAAGGTAIQIGQGNTGTYLAHTVRHEVGHAVHDQIRGTVNPWLQREMEFWYYGGGADDVLTWLRQVGSFPASYRGADGRSAAFGDAQAMEVAQMVETWVGQASWSPTRANVTDGQSPDRVALWNALPDTMKNAVIQSKANWYTNYANFQTGANGRQYFLNHWYHRAYYIGRRARQTIDAIGENYTAMSEFEFFANCYAEFFKDPAGYTDNSRWGGNLPADVKQFFRNHVLARNPYRPGAADAPAAAAGEAGTGSGNRREEQAAGMPNGSTGVEGATQSDGGVQGGAVN